MIKLSKKLQDVLLNWPEDGMGYQVVNLILEDNTRIRNVVVLNGEEIKTLTPEQVQKDIIAIEHEKGGCSLCNGALPLGETCASCGYHKPDILGG